MQRIENEFLRVTIAEKGAELKSIFSKKDGIEYMWQSMDPWPKSSPILFPIVGTLKNNEYQFEGKTYKLSRHGFARDMDFKIEASSKAEVTFSITDSEATRKVFPFQFKLTVQYTLNEDILQAKYIVQNPGSKTMYFSLGAHPAFAVPFVGSTRYDDYALQFDQIENTPRWPITPEGLISNESLPLLHNSDTLYLSKELFEKDAIVLKDLKSERVTLQTNKSPHGLTFQFKGFPYFGIWAAPGADFVCIEPWAGIADGVNASGNLEEKEGIQQLEAHKNFQISWSAEFF